MYKRHERALPTRDALTQQRGGYQPHVRFSVTGSFLDHPVFYILPDFL